MIIRHEKWPIQMQLAAHIAKFAANLSGSFGYVVTSKQWNAQFVIMNLQDKQL